MAGSPSKIPENRYHVRSTSMPTRTHPLELIVEEEINRLKTWVVSSSMTNSSLTAEMICVGLGGLKSLYDCVEDVLQLPLSQQVLVHDQHQKWAEELLYGSVTILDVCSTTRDLLLRMKENSQDLRAALRKRSGDLGMGNKVIRYSCSRKKVMKDINKCIGELKRMDNKCASSSLLDQDQHLRMVVGVLGEAKSITISIFHAVLSFMSASRPKPKSSKWSLVSKLIHKRQVACIEGQKVTNEIESAEASLCMLSAGHISCKDIEMEKVQKVQNQLENLEFCIEKLEAGLESLFRRIIKTRVSLLNIITQ